jgi:hypothetical protein
LDVSLLGVPLLGVPLLGVPLLGVPLLGVPLLGVPLLGVSLNETVCSNNSSVLLSLVVSCNVSVDMVCSNSNVTSSFCPRGVLGRLWSSFTSSMTSMYWSSDCSLSSESCTTLEFGLKETSASSASSSTPSRVVNWFEIFACWSSSSRKESESDPPDEESEPSMSSVSRRPPPPPDEESEESMDSVDAFSSAKVSRLAILIFCNCGNPSNLASP